MTQKQRLKICIPIPHRSQGGVYTFLRNWRQWLDTKGVPHTQNPDHEYDVYFINSWMVPYRQVRNIKEKRPQVRIVHRIDGSVDDYGRFGTGDAIQARVNTLADLTIFQSQYSVHSTRRKFRVIPNSGPVIYNPVDINLFSPSAKRLDVGTKPTICCTAYSLNRKKGTWQIARLAAQNPDIQFILCGRFPPLPDLPNTKLLGHLSPGELAGALRSSHIYLSLAQNDPCPNVVLEALATGLPVLYIPSGGTPELIQEAGLPFELSSFRVQFDAIWQNRTALAQTARHRAETFFAPDVIFPQYVEAIVRASQNPIPSAVDLIKLRRQGYPVLPMHWRYLQSAVTNLPARLVRVLKKASLFLRSDGF